MVRNHQPRCDLQAVWNPDPDPYPLPLGSAPGSVDDPESGILTNPSKQIVFYEVKSPSNPGSVRCVKNVANETVTVYD